MTDAHAEEASDRIVLRLDPGGPMEVGDLTNSFSALARLYERHYRTGGEPAPKLFITRLETGSIIAEIAPLINFLGNVVTSMDTTLIVADFTRRLSNGIKAFADPVGAQEASGPEPSRDDAADLREFVRPLAGRKGASLGIRHARFVREEGERRTIAEYVFDEAEINRATINIEGTLEEPTERQVFALEAQSGPHHETAGILREVVLVFDQASRRPGKEKGRTGDRGIISEVSSKALPVHFRKATQDLKDRMVRGDVNALANNAFVVDAYVTRIDGEPKAYVITEVHTVLPLDDD